MKTPELSDSDSDFETVPPKKRQCIDLTTPDDSGSITNLMSRMESLEKSMKQSLVHLEDELKKIITTLENEKIRLIEEKRVIEGP